MLVQIGIAGSGRRPRRARRPRRLTAMCAVVALVSSATLIGGMSEADAATPVSQASGQFLSGSAAGLDLNTLVSVLPAGAINSGGTAQSQVNPLSVTALQAVDVDLGGGVNLLGNNSILQLGAVNQYAHAAPDGSSAAASGAVSDSGAIAVGGSADAPANASVNLQPLIGPGLTSTVGDLDLTVGALSAAAQQTAAGSQFGQYQIANLTLTLNSPLVQGTYTNLRASLVALQPVVNGLPALIRALPGVGPLATITGLPNLATVVDGALGPITSPDGSIVANLKTGAVSIDVAKLLTTAGLDLNNLPPNSELLPYLTAGLTSQLLPAISTALTGLSTALTTAVNAISVSVLGIPVALAVLAPVLNPVIAQLVAPVNTVIAGLASTVITPLATALTALLGLQANVQQDGTDGSFTERALSLSLLPGAGLAQVNLASATVGPNAGPAAPVVPTTTSLTPDAGPVAGGQLVTVTGTDFLAGATSVTIGGVQVPAAVVTVNSPTSLSFSTPAHPAGPVGVTVSTAGGTSTPALTYTYVPPAAVPTALSVSPSTGPVSGGQTVAVHGSNFVPGATTVTIGGITIPAADVIVIDPADLTFSTPAHAAGPVGVTVTTAGGTTSPALDYTYESGPITPEPPVALALSPTTGPVAGGQTVSISGNNFVGGSTSVTIGGTVVPAAAVDVTSATTLTFRTPAHPAGPVAVTVTTPAGTSSPTLQYTYESGPITPEPPVALALSPTTGPVAGGQTVAITGQNFVPGATSVTIGGIVVPADEVSVLSPTALSFTTPAHPAGAVDVTVTTDGGTSSPALDYTYESGPITPAPPVALTLSPDHGPVLGGQTVTVSGSGFIVGATSVTIGATVIPAAEVTVSSTTTLTFQTPVHAAGAVDVIVTTPNGTSTPALQYTYESGPITPEPPVVFSLAPGSGPVAGGQTVAILGIGFVAGQTTVTIGGNTVPATVISPTALILLTPAHPAGAVDVTVSTPAGTSSPALQYTYLDGPIPPEPPVALLLTPTSGPIAGGQMVTVTGVGFVAGDTSVTIGGTTVPASVTSGDTLSFTTPAHPAGGVDVTVSTAAGTSGPALSYTYVAVAVPAPKALALTPAVGPAAGGQTVTVTGSGFVAGGTTVQIGGVTIPAPSVQVLSPTSLRFSTPAHPAGAVDVTVTTRSGTSSPALSYRYLPGVGVNPPAPVLSTPTDGATITDPSPVVTGTGVAGDMVNVHEGAIPLCTAVVPAGGSWMCTVQTVLTDGSHTISASQTDPAGLFSTESESHTFTVDSSGDLGDGATAGGAGSPDGSDGGSGSGAGAGGDLAYTGSQLLNLVMLALALMGVGGLLAATGRRPLVQRRPLS